jgi:hypothetical protein
MAPLTSWNGGGGSNSPVISGLSVTYNGKKSITISGTVTDPLSSSAGLTITFTGQATGTAVTDGNGYFSFTTDAIGLGTVLLSTSDHLGLGANAGVSLQAPAPTISNFAVSEGGNAIFTFSGTVSAMTPNGLTVTFGGIPALLRQTATVGSDGSFQLLVHLQADGSDNGMATAQTTDWWGQLSNQATVSVYVTP